MQLIWEDYTWPKDGSILRSVSKNTPHGKRLPGCIARNIMIGRYGEIKADSELKRFRIREGKLEVATLDNIVFKADTSLEKIAQYHEVRLPSNATTCALEVINSLCDNITG